MAMIPTLSDHCRGSGDCGVSAGSRAPLCTSKMKPATSRSSGRSGQDRIRAMSGAWWPFDRWWPGNPSLRCRLRWPLRCGPASRPRWTDHGAVGVLDHADPGHAEQVDGQDQGPQGVVGHPRPGVADDLGVAGPQPEHGQRIDPRIDTGQDGEALGRRSGHTRIVELGAVAPVGVEQVVEDRFYAGGDGEVSTSAGWPRGWTSAAQEVSPCGPSPNPARCQSTKGLVRGARSRSWPAAPQWQTPGRR
jgi:hypothetical protein